MFTLSKIYGTLTRQRLVKDRDVQEFVDASFNDSSDDTDTDDDGGDNDNDGGDSDNDGGDNDNDGGDSDNDGGDNDNDGGDNDNHNDNDDDDAAESNPSPHSPHSFTRSGGNSRNDSGIPFEVPSRWCRGEAVTRLSLAKNPSSRHGMKATEPFPDIDPLVLAIGIHEFDDPPNLQGLEINNVEIYLGRLRDDPVFGYREACAGNVISSAGDDTDDASAQVLDTSVDFTSTCVSRSSSSTMSTMSVKDSRHKKVAQSGSKQESKVPKDTSHSPVKDSRKLSNSMTLDDTVGPRYQLPDKNMEDYMQRVSARVHAVLAKQDGEKRIDSPVSSSASSNEDFDTSEELTFNDNDTCPSSPTTPFTPRTPLNHRNLSKLVTPPTISEIEEDEPQPAAAKTLEWAPPPITGPPIFNLNKTRLTPPRSEVYKHIDFTPLPLFHRRSPTQRYIILEQDCLQCSLKNLPCDDYHPSCKRCQRSGDAPYCLRQRRLASWELKQLGLERVNRYTVLVRLPEDGDDVWEEKLRREHVLLEGLRERFDKRNWVFPIDDGVRGLFDDGAVRGKEVCEGRGGVWRYRFVDDLLRY